VNLIIGLHRSLKLMFEEGIENRFRRHKNLSKVFRSGVQQLGLRLVAKSEDIAASTVTAVYLPENVELGEFRKEMLRRNVVVAGGLYPSIKSRYFRVGHMGPINANDIISVVAAIERSLKRLGYEAKLGDGVSAAQKMLNDFSL
jgi:alanine-glyoxylate transaminase/serine-glyoxylate transaminase/serine-pyruvate transaminase